MRTPFSTPERNDGRQTVVPHSPDDLLKRAVSDHPIDPPRELIVVYAPPRSAAV